ncbi:MAG: CDP-glycerol glycerophosphotransferase family protein [Proteobacteria bacterium]|nr:CDP-glycerol glycerophosphotransferase family protein [Pseudomonadota bacterium]
MAALSTTRNFLAGLLGRRAGASAQLAPNPRVVALEATGIFDRARYLQWYPDVADSGADPLVHYADRGGLEGRSPCEYFDGAYYLASNPDVAAAGSNPLLHFCEFGWRESRHPAREFDVDWYAATHLGDSAGAVNPLIHYLTTGRAGGLQVRAVLEPMVQELYQSGAFDPDYYLANCPDAADSGMDPADHYLKHGAAEGCNPSAMFNTRYYLKNNTDVARARLNPLLHFCRSGWKELRNPSAQFDVWWYWSTHMDPACDTHNPLAHYQATGAALGLDTRPPAPPPQLPGSGHRHPAGAVVRRVCLYAGYDPDGLIDQHVVDYLRELSRHADVYYLADCEMQPGELDKIADYTRAAWAERHGEYDFGSYSRLARQKVGWDEIERYDELILANDSCYLLRDLQHVFSKMDQRACDWWGMQATKGIAATRHNPRNRFLEPIPVDTVRSALLGSFEREYCYDFLVGSYFVVYRRPVIGDAQFRRLLDTVVAQESKRTLILKYEIGLTRYLIAKGFAFDTFVEYLYPFHPIYSNWYFRLLEEGFPFLKRYFLSDNHYRVPALADWKARILRKVPGADVERIGRNLERVTDPDKLHASLNVGTARALSDAADDAVPEELLDNQQFLAADQRSPKYSDWWAFPVCAFTGVFSGNERALFEHVKDDAAIRKIVLTRGQPVAVGGSNVEIVPLQSPRGQYLLMRSGNIFIKHSPTRNLLFPVAGELHNLINLWHGIPFKRIGYASLDMQDNRRAIAREHLKCRAVISSSKVDSMAMASAFYPLSFGEVWPTGLPRNDFILRDLDRLPEDLKAESARLEAMLDGRKLVLFMPTFRNGQEDGYYHFSEREIDQLDDWLKRNNAVLGLREHMADSARTYTRLLSRLSPLDLADAHFPNVEILYRVSSALITDYSSSFIDYMLTGKPAISFAYDYDLYRSIERGAFYDLDFIFPGPVCYSFAQLSQALESLFEPRSQVQTATLEWKRRMFFDHLDDGSSARVADRVKQLTDLQGLGQQNIAIGI